MANSKTLNDDYLIEVPVPKSLQASLGSTTIEIVINRDNLEIWDEEDRGLVSDIKPGNFTRSIICISIREYGAYDILGQLSLIFPTPKEYADGGIEKEMLSTKGTKLLRGLVKLEESIEGALHAAAIKYKVRVLH